jgi:ureidoglycolate lyase
MTETIAPYGVGCDIPRLLPVQPLTGPAFADYGQVIEAGPETRCLWINAGTAKRYNDLARLDLTADGGRPLVSIFRARARPSPLRLQLMERHQLGSQAFMPLGPSPFLVVVALADIEPQWDDLRAFIAQPGQGINFSRGTWHHPLVALADSDFLVIDRGAADGKPDCEEVDIAHWNAWV